MQQRRDPPSEQMHTLVSANEALRTDKARLESDNASLRASQGLLDRRIRSLQVILALLLAITAGLAVGMATSMAGAGVQVALGSATGVFFAVIMASMAVLSYIRD
jgi:hypothetical protein